MNKEYRISDHDNHVWFTQTPNIVLKSSVSMYAKFLYVHLKMVAGDYGVCWQSSETLSAESGISEGKISECKRELEDAGFIRIEDVDHIGGGRKSHHIHIINIWDKNYEAYEQYKTGKTQASSPGEVASSCSELASSWSEVKNIPIKNNPLLSEPKVFSTADDLESELPKPTAVVQNQDPPKPRPEEARRASSAAALMRGVQRHEGVKGDLYRLFHINVNTENKSKKEFVEFIMGRPAEETLEKFAQYWYSEDWRGKNGQPPTPAQIMELWPQAFIQKEIWDKSWEIVKNPEQLKLLKSGKYKLVTYPNGGYFLRKCEITSITVQDVPR